MSEFKAQILGLIIVVGLFAVVSAAATDLFTNTLNQVDTYNSVQISNAIA